MLFSTSNLKLKTHEILIIIWAKNTKLPKNRYLPFLTKAVILHPQILCVKLI